MMFSLRKLLTVSSLLLVIACGSEGGIFDDASYDFLDRDLELNREDYENMDAPKQADFGKDAKPIRGVLAPPVPEMAQILAAPKPPEVGRTKLVTVSVTDDVPLKDVLIELSRLADVDIELGPGIYGGISFSAKNKPFNEVIARIADLSGLRYRMHDGVLRVERDTPYLKNYALDFLNIVRNSESEVNVSTDVLSSGGDSGGGGGSSGGSGGGSSGGGGEGLSIGSTSSIKTQTESDFWQALETNMTQILSYAPVIELQPLPGELPEGTDLAAQAGAAPAQPVPQPRQSTSGSGQTGSTGLGGGSAQGANGSFYVMNRQAGILSVSATERQHEMLRKYLNYLERNASAQVLIEAKIVEVELNKGYQSGVNWNAVIGNTDFNVAYPTTFTNGSTLTVLGPGIDPTDGVGPANPTGDNNLGINLDAVVQLTERFGTSRTLSSPRLHAINNQQAVLTFAENRIFFEVDVQREDDQVVNDTTIPGTTSIESTRRSVPIGIILNILPSINLDRNEVTLSVRPTLSRQVDTVQDPGSALLNNDLDADQQFINEVPVVEVRELDSVMKLKSGSVMVIGGLMEDVTRNDDEGVPFVSGVPWIGNAFKSTLKSTTKRELIIFIKASIIDSDGGYTPADKTIYEKFSDDPRPLVFH